MNTLQITGFELPDRYEKDALQLLVRDALALYVYWEVSNRKRWLCAQHFECDWGLLPKILRLYDVTAVYFNGSNANRYIDIQTTPEATNWYIHQAAAATTYMIDFGTYTINGQFVPILRSNAVATPRDSTASWGEPIQSVVPEVRDGNTAHRRIEAHFFENINAYSNCMK